MRGVLAVLLFSAATVQGQPCVDEKVIVHKPRVIAVPGVDAAREVVLDVLTCEGSDLDRLLTDGRDDTPIVHLTFQDVPHDAISILKGGKPIRPSGAPPLVLIDAGTPGSKDMLTKDVADAATKLKKVHPGWDYALIRGDEERCELGPVVKGSKLDLATLPGFTAERLDQMAETFCRADAPRSLVILSGSGPVWLAREVTEWLTDSGRIAADDEDARRALGQGEQKRILAHGSVGRSLERLFESNRVILAAGPASASPLSVAVTAAAKAHGGFVPLGSVGAGEHSKFCDVRTTYQGTVRFDMSAVRQHPSGVQRFDVRLVANDQILAQGDQDLPDATRRDWQRELIEWILPFLTLMVVLTMGLFLLGFLKDRSAKLFGEVRNALYGLVAVTIGMALAILPMAETSKHRDTFIWTLGVSVFLLIAAVLFTYIANFAERRSL